MSDLLLFVLAVVGGSALVVGALLIEGAASKLGAEPTVVPFDPALQAFARVLKRPRLEHLHGDTMRLEGRLRGERVSAHVWAAAHEVRADVRVEAMVPVPLTGTVLRGRTGPRLAGDRELPASFREAGPDLALRTLLRHVDEVKLGLSGLEARSREPLGERTLLVVAEALIALAGFVRTDEPPKPDPVARLIATRTRPADAVRGAGPDGPRVVVRGAQVCPFCRDAIDAAAQDAVACEGCATLHHGECWAENGRCTVRGCEQVRAERVPDL